MSIFALLLHQLKGILVPALHRGGLRLWERGPLRDFKNGSHAFPTKEEALAGQSQGTYPSGRPDGLFRQGRDQVAGNVAGLRSHPAREPATEREPGQIGRGTDLFGANRGPRPSVDGLASLTKMKTFWVIKYLNTYSTNK